MKTASEWKPLKKPNVVSGNNSSKSASSSQQVRRVPPPEQPPPGYFNTKELQQFNQFNTVDLSKDPQSHHPLEIVDWPTSTDSPLCPPPPTREHSARRGEWARGQDRRDQIHRKVNAKEAAGAPPPTHRLEYTYHPESGKLAIKLHDGETTFFHHPYLHPSSALSAQKKQEYAAFLARAEYNDHRKLAELRAAGHATPDSGSGEDASPNPSPPRLQSNALRGDTEQRRGGESRRRSTGS